MSSKNKEEFIVLIDLDGVCASIHTKWLAHYNLDYGDDLTEEDVHGWDMHNYVKDECGLDIYQYINMPGFFYFADVVPGSVEALKSLVDEGLTIVICTASPSASHTAYYEKSQWVKRFFPFIQLKNFVSTHRKDLVRGDLMLDDGPHNLLAFPGISCAFSRPWNRNCESDYTVSTWEEFKELAISLAKKKKSSMISGEKDV